MECFLQYWWYLVVNWNQHTAHCWCTWQIFSSLRSQWSVCIYNTCSRRMLLTFCCSGAALQNAPPGKHEWNWRLPTDRNYRGETEWIWRSQLALQWSHSRRHVIISPTVSSKSSFVSEDNNTILIEYITNSHNTCRHGFVCVWEVNNKIVILYICWFLRLCGFCVRSRE